MAPPRGSVAYKKQDGILAISKDRKSVSWTPGLPLDASPTLVISAATITQLQQTAENKAKVMLKVFVQDKTQSEPTSHIFNFTSPSDARAQANAIKEALTNAIQAAKAAQNVVGVPGEGSSAAMAIANAISGAKIGNTWEDDDRLKSDVSLQQSLMREDPELQRTFIEARKTKPDSISNTQFTAQFWSSRVPLLRSHAIAKSQSRGSYNVLSTLRKEEGGKKMNLSPEHVHLIFSQYPLMRRVYDEVVPKPLNEHDFWSRFFQSRLYMKLRGEKYDKDRDSKDGILDPYLDAPEFTGVRQRTGEMHIPRILDMEGNEENHSQRKGNAPDRELRPQSHDKVPIIRTLNSLSEKLMAHVAPSDIDPSQPIGMDEVTFNNLRLRDLQGDPEQNRIILKIRDQSRFFSDGSDSQVLDKSSTAPKQDPDMAIKKICADLAKKFPQPGAGVINLGIAEHEAEESDEENNKSFESSADASAHIMELVRQHRSQTEEIPTSSGLSTAVYERVTLTHATTTEFLHQFWSAFLSGDPDRANEVLSLAESLNKALDRIKAVADDAEEERNTLIRKTQKQAKDIQERTGKKQRIDYKAIGGGAEIVNQLLGPTTKALANTTARFQKALKEQTAGQDG